MIIVNKKYWYVEFENSAVEQLQYLDNLIADGNKESLWSRLYDRPLLNSHCNGKITDKPTIFAGNREEIYKDL